MAAAREFAQRPSVLLGDQGDVGPQVNAIARRDGAAFMALGCFASALTRNQIVAAMLALCGGVALFLVSFLGNRLDADTGLSAQVFAYLNLFDHMDDFARGVLDSRAVVLFGTLTVSFLFLTLRVVESRRWR